MIKHRLIFLAALAFLTPLPFPRAARAEKIAPPPLSFEPLSIPFTAAEKNAIRVSPKATTYCCGGKLGKYALEYRVLLRGGAADKDGHIAGLITGADGLPLKRPGGAPVISNSPDANGLIMAGGKHYLFTQYGTVPGAVHLAELNADKDGNFGVKEFAPVDLGGVGGTLGNDGGSITPWGTHLVSENNYLLDAYWFTHTAAPYNIQHIERCAKTASGGLTPTVEGSDLSGWCDAVGSMRDGYLKDPGAFSPYRYGFNIELAVNRNGAPSVKDGVKRYAMGRFAPEMALVMPDRRTVYLSDGGPNSGFFMFVADDRNDLSSGSLYIAQWRQRAQGADITWVPLGHGTDKEVGAMIDLRPELSDIFDVGDPLACPAGYRMIKAGPSGANCLRLRDGKNGSAVSPKFGTRINPLMAAAFLETRRYGALLGGTTGWNNTKGLAYDDDHRALFMAVDGIDGGMADDLRMPKNSCGAIFRFKLGEAHDTAGKKINSQFAATGTEQETAGAPLSPGQPYADENACHPDSIANPADVRYIGHNILLIGENGPLHFNNYVWAYDVKRKKLTRIASVPSGAGISGTFAPLDTLERFYIFMNVTHPLDSAALNAEGKQANGPLVNNATAQRKKGYIGYISGLPGLGR